MEKMIETASKRIFIQIDNGDFLEFKFNLQMQMLFDDVIAFISKTDFE